MAHKHNTNNCIEFDDGGRLGRLRERIVDMIFGRGGKKGEKERISSGDMVFNYRAKVNVRMLRLPL